MAHPHQEFPGVPPRTTDHFAKILQLTENSSFMQHYRDNTILLLQIRQLKTVFFKAKNLFKPREQYRSSRYLTLKDKILTRFQLLSSSYPKPLVRITNKVILTERLIDSTICSMVIAFLTSVVRAAFVEEPFWETSWFS